MSEIRLEGLTKVYPNGTVAVSELSLEVAEGELMVLVGPSGCGKTTALRMVAGLEDVTAGAIRIGERVVNDLPPRERDVAMVFQTYALYPHMSVAENIGFALRLRKLPKEEARAKVADAARILGIAELLDRKPAQLSGGQRQRVAMGRAIVREPEAFLMDEPLSNLDAKLRVQMRAEVSRVQRRLGVATLYVTHDQTEAMTMGHRVAVMRSGHLQQVEAPQDLYDHPANIFVAAFIGSPAMNLYEGTLAPDGSSVQLGSQTLALPARLAADPLITGYRGQAVVVGIRPEHMSDAALGSAGSSDAGRRLEGDVELVESLGSEKLVHFRIDADRLRTADTEPAAEGDADAASLVQGEIGAAAFTAATARVDVATRLRAGDRAVLEVDVDKLLLFDPQSGRSIG